MLVYVKVEYTIDDVIAWHCIQSLMNEGKRVTKKKVVDTCRAAFYSNGCVFETEPEFNQDNWIREVPDDFVQKVFDKIWK